jgi:hypothetical protein
MIRASFIAFILAVGLGQTAQAEEMRFHQAVSQPEIKARVVEMLGEQPKWVSFVLDKGGVEGKSITLTLADQDYEYYETCRPYECNMKRIGMMIGADGSIYLRLFGTKTEDRIFGAPTAEIEKVLRAQG